MQYYGIAFLESQFVFVSQSVKHFFISLVKQRSEKITVRSKILTAIFMGLLVSVIHIVSVMVNSSVNLFTSRGGQEVVVLNTNLLSKHAEKPYTLNHSQDLIGNSP